MSKPKISIIVPVYNTAKYLTKCLDSILNQTFQDFEIIIVSDGPLDADIICDSYEKKYSNIKLIKNINKGLGGARNKGLDIAQGEYILFVDSDDWIENDLKKLLEYFNDSIDVIVFGINLIKDNCSIRKSLRKYFDLKFNGLTRIDDNVIFNTNVQVWNKIYKKSIIDKFNIKFPENMHYEDFPFHFIYFANIKQAYYLNEKFYNYLQRKDSLIRATYRHELNKIKDHINGCYFIFQKFKELNIFENNKILFSKIYGEWILTALRHLKKDDKSEFLNFAYEVYKKMGIAPESSEVLKMLENKKFENIIKKFYKEEIKTFFKIPILKIRYCFNGKRKFYLFSKIFIGQKLEEEQCQK